jgi:hypothetical protein
MKKLIMLAALVLGLMGTSFAQKHIISQEGKTYYFPCDSDEKLISVEIKSGKPIVKYLKKGKVEENYGVEVVGKATFRLEGNKNYMTTNGKLIYYPYDGSASYSIEGLTVWTCTGTCKDGQRCSTSNCNPYCCTMTGGNGLDTSTSTYKFGGGGGITVIIDNF